MAKPRKHKEITPPSEAGSARGVGRPPESTASAPGRPAAGRKLDQHSAILNYNRDIITKRLTEVLREGLSERLHYDVVSIFSFEPVTSEFKGVVQLASNAAIARVIENPPAAGFIDEEVVKSGLIQTSTTTLEIYKDGIPSLSTNICLVAPLQYKKRVIGVLNVQAERESPYSKAEVVVLGEVAKQLVITLESIVDDTAAVERKELANLGPHVFRLFPGMGDEKRQLTPARSELEDAVRILSSGLISNLLNAEWLLENLPDECHAIASAFRQADEAHSPDESQIMAINQKRRTACSDSENEQGPGQTTNVMPRGGSSSRADASLQQNSPDEALQEISCDSFFRWFDARVSSRSRDFLQQRLTQFAHAQQGRNFGTAEANSQFAKGLHSRMKQVGLFVACPGSSGIECGAASYFRCKPRHPSYPTGAFYFEHADQEQATHGWSENVPELNFLGPDGKPLTFA